MKYRADIDGLRTVAVIPVVLFHAGLSLFSGGFVGVDVFFVISGFLITGILLQSIEEKRFSILDFYQRRIKRIFPALLLIMTATTALGLVFFTPARFLEYSQSLVSVSIFSSNFYFWKSVDYFSTQAHIQPLLHTWSLAVEEQFYIFYPILLLIVARTKFDLKYVLIAIFVISLALASVLIYAAPGAVFYMLPTRAWELVLGGLIATGFPSPSSNRRVTLVCSIVGVVAITASVVFYTSETIFPGLTALPPAIGAALLIWSGISTQSPVHKILSAKPFVLIGRASYSFYLWHFPLFAFAAYLTGGKFSAAVGLAISFVSFSLSLVTLRWIETPLRNSKNAKTVPLLLTGMIAAGLAGLYLMNTDGLPSRLSPIAANYAKTAEDKNIHPIKCMSNGDIIVPPEKACKFGNMSSKPVALLWGDSHAMVTATALEKAALRKNSAFLFAAAADCPVGIGFGISASTATKITSGRAYQFCQKYNDSMLQLALRNPDIQSVVLSARWTNWRLGEAENPVETPWDIRLFDDDGTAVSKTDNARIFEKGFITLIRRLNAAGKKVYIVGPLPEPKLDVPQTLFVARYGFTKPPEPIRVKDFLARNEKILNIFTRVSEVAPVRIISPHERLCNTLECAVVDKNEPLYFDHNHLSVYGAEKTSPIYDIVFDTAQTPALLSFKP
jgi:peptidoglycan/LPS O-acetylase OafA/YrhL